MASVTTQTMTPDSWNPARVTGDVSPTYLVAIAGPAREPIVLMPPRDVTDAIVGAGVGVEVGRGDSCDLRLDAEQVSRRHARLSYNAERRRWSIADVGSRWGTFVNGRKLGERHADERIFLAEGDLVRITPWTFLVSTSQTPRGLEISDRSVSGSVRNVRAGDLPAMQQGRLELLLSSAAELQEAGNVNDLAARLLRLAQKGTDLANGAVLRPLDAEGRYEVMVAQSSTTPCGEADGARFAFSRTLLDAARNGDVAEVRGDVGPDDSHISPYSQSIVQMQITRAVCVPVMLGPTTSLLLYLDQRGDTFTGVSDQAASTAFCLSLGKVASLALANLKRLEMERRAAEMETEMQAAAAAQQWILPARELIAGGYRVVGESRAGQGVGGDFFDVIQLGPRRIAVTLGDVSGKGVSASVLMTATQGFLHAVLNDACGEGCATHHCADSLAKAVTRLGAFLHPRRPASRFVTLWVGVFDADAGKLSYVDAGHGLGLLRRTSGQVVELATGGGMPVGILPDAVYIPDTIGFHPGDAVLVVSDGIVEQPRSGAAHERLRNEFDLPRTKSIFARYGAAGESHDVIGAIFDAVITHAGTDRLADDATAVVVRTM